MKNVFSIFLIILSSAVFSQEGINFQKIPFAELLAKAKKENKLLFIDAMASWCGPCKMMERNVFPQKEVGNFYNNTFINAQFDMEKGEGREIASKYAVYSYPTYLFINGDGQLITKNMGYIEAEPFLKLGKEASSAIKNIDKYREKFNKGEKNPEMLMNIMKLNRNSDFDFGKMASERYFKNKKNNEITEDETEMLLHYIKSSEDANYSFFTNHKEDLLTKMSEAQYKDYDMRFRMESILKNTIDDKNKTIREDYFLTNVTPIFGKEGAEESLSRLKLNYYELNDNFPEYEKAAISLLGRESIKLDPTVFLKAAWIFSEKDTNTESLKAATVWAEKSVMSSETPENTYILAKLYQKTGKKQEALMYAESSLNLGRRLSKDTALAEKLISELK